MADSTGIEIDGSTITQAVVDAVTSPKKVEVDGQKVEQHDLSELIEAHKYLMSANASKAKGSGIKFSKFMASGSVR